MRDIWGYMSKDHERLDELLLRARARPDSIDLKAYEEFRKGILKHIGMEEIVLFPCAKAFEKKKGDFAGSPSALAAKARLDHGAITALLIPNPTQPILSALSAILEGHNRMEDRAGGLYDLCESELGESAPQVLDRLKNATDIPPAVHVDSPRVMASVWRALAAAGHAHLLPE